MSGVECDWANKVAHSPWKSIDTDVKHVLLLKVSCKPAALCLLLLDPQDMSMWSEQLTAGVLAARATRMNPSLEFNEESFTTLLTNTILRSSDTVEQKDVTVFSWKKGDASSVFTRDEAVLSFQKSGVGNYRWNFKLTRCERSGELLTQHLVQPMAALINVLVTERDALVETVKAKTEDMHNAKKLLGEIDRKKFRNSKFDKKAFRTACYEKNTKSDGFKNPMGQLMGAETDFQTRYSDMQNGIKTAHARPDAIITETPSGNITIADPVATVLVRSAFGPTGAVAVVQNRKSAAQGGTTAAPTDEESATTLEKQSSEPPEHSHRASQAEGESCATEDGLGEVLEPPSQVLKRSIEGDTSAQTQLPTQSQTQTPSATQDTLIPTSRPKKRKKRNIN